MWRVESAAEVDTYSSSGTLFTTNTTRRTRESSASQNAILLTLLIAFSVSANNSLAQDETEMQDKKAVAADQDAYANTEVSAEEKALHEFIDHEIR